MRQYYDIYCLLGDSEIQEFIGSHEYSNHKAKRIKGEDSLIALKNHPAFLLNDSDIKASFNNRYVTTSKLYYNGQPDFEEILERITQFLPRL
jgi:hypothetical protein